MKQTTKGLCQSFIRMIDEHANANDNEFVGQIILYSLGIDGFCMGFCKGKAEDEYNLTWSLGNGDLYHHSFTKKEIETALINSHFEYSIKVELK